MGDDGVDHVLALLERERDAFAVGAEREDAVGAAVFEVGEVLGDPAEEEFAAAFGHRRDRGGDDSR